MIITAFIIISAVTLFSSRAFAAEIYEDIIERAEAGDRVARYNLGVMYFSGDELPQDFEKAFYWFDKAAMQNDWIAQFYLGKMYCCGEAGETDPVEAAALNELSAKSGDESAVEVLATYRENMNEEEAAIVAGRVQMLEAAIVEEIARVRELKARPREFDKSGKWIPLN